MDFDADHMKDKGYGIYTRMPLQLLDDCCMVLAIADDPSDSGKIHATVREVRHPTTHTRMYANVLHIEINKGKSTLHRKQA